MILPTTEVKRKYVPNILVVRFSTFCEHNDMITLPFMKILIVAHSKIDGFSWLLTLHHFFHLMVTPMVWDGHGI